MDQSSHNSRRQLNPPLNRSLSSCNVQCVFNAKSMPGCLVNQRHNTLFCEGKFVIKFRDGHFGRSITEVDHKAGNFHQMRWPGSKGSPRADARGASA